MGVRENKASQFRTPSGRCAAKLGCLLAVSALGAFAALRATGRVAFGAESHGLLIVANSNDAEHRNGEGYLTLIDPKTAKVIGKIPDGGVTAHEVIVSKDGTTAYAPIYGNANVGGAGTDGRTISVIDISAEKQVGTIDFGRGVRPHFGVWGSDGMIYVTTELEQTVAVIDPKMQKIVGSIPTGAPESHNVAVSHDGRRAYTSNVDSGTVSVMDVRGRKLITTVSVTSGSFVSPLGDKDPRKDWKVQRVAVSPDDRTVFTCDWTTSDLVAISTATNTVTGRVHLAAPCYGEALTADGRYALAVVIANQLAVVDVAQMKVAQTVDLPSAPQQVLIRPDGEQAYVSCHGAQDQEKVVFVRTADWTIDGTVPTGYWPDGLGWSALDPKLLRPGQ